jgi:hypothetical protein
MFLLLILVYFRLKKAIGINEMVLKGIRVVTVMGFEDEQS